MNTEQNPQVIPGQPTNNANRKPSGFVPARIEDNRNYSLEERAAALAARSVSTPSRKQTLPATQKPTAAPTTTRSPSPFFPEGQTTTSTAAMSGYLPASMRTPVQPAPPGIRKSTLAPDATAAQKIADNALGTHMDADGRPATWKLPSTMAGREGSARMDNAGPSDPTTTYTNRDGVEVRRVFGNQQAAGVPAQPAAANPMPRPAPAVGPASLGNTAAVAQPPMRIFEHAREVPQPAAAVATTPPMNAAGQNRAMVDEPTNSLNPPVINAGQEPQSAPTPAPTAAPVAPVTPAAPAAPSFFGTDRDNALNQQRVKSAVKGALGTATGVIGKVASRMNPANYTGPTVGSDGVFTYRSPALNPQPVAKPPAQAVGMSSRGPGVPKGNDLPTRSLFGLDNPGARADLDRVKKFGSALTRNLAGAF